MTEFRRPPEWQQQADRHTALIDPVLTVRPISRFDYTARRQVGAIDHALVFVTASGSYDVFLPPRRPSRAEAATRRYTSVYEVDMGSHPVRLELELPSDDDAFAFGVTADLTWRVSDPVAFVVSGERDVPTRLTRELQQAARPVTRRFPIDDSPAAERAVQRAVEEEGDFAAGTGLTVSCVVRLRLDDDAIAHRRRRRTLRYESEMLDPEHEYRLRQARLEHELEVLREHQSQELIAQKIAFHQHHLQHGGVGAWAFHLAAHPRDTRMVIQTLQKDQLGSIRKELEVIAGDTLEDFQKAESARSVLRSVDDLLREQTPPALPPGAPPPSPYGEAPQPPYPGAPAPQQPYAPAPQQPYVPQQPYAPGTPSYAPGTPSYAPDGPTARYGAPQAPSQVPYDPAAQGSAGSYEQTAQGPTGSYEQTLYAVPTPPPPPMPPVTDGPAPAVPPAPGGYAAEPPEAGSA
ncbi:PE-PGRS family protein [Streptomyces sp. NBC_00289]|uniref:PE-PGRS family protein n=1 Tax=Streptomyces sp. NBC_00289 TaxID=2975703 RepID=UPI0032533E2D